MGQVYKTESFSETCSITLNLNSYVVLVQNVVNEWTMQTNKQKLHAIQGNIVLGC